MIKESRDDVINSLVLGILFAGIVVLFSFGDLRNTLITVAGLPVCIIAAFAVMSLLGYTVNMITLLALSLSVGLLIDDAIVVRENIFRHMDKLGKDPRQAASEGTSEVGLAVMATTLTVVAVFLPVAFSGGIAGKFMRQFGVTVAAAVLISLFEAFTFAPMLSAYFFKKVEKSGRKTISSRFQNLVSSFYGVLGNNYRPTLRWALRHRKTVIFDDDRHLRAERLPLHHRRNRKLSARGTARIQPANADLFGQLARADGPDRPVDWKRSSAGSPRSETWRRSSARPTAPPTWPRSTSN